MQTFILLQYYHFYYRHCLFMIYTRLTYLETLLIGKMGDKMIM